MKKSLLLFCLLLAAATLSAQEHLTFMGIPLDGDIAQFESRLVAQGFVPDDAFNRLTPEGVRIYNHGLFFAEETQVLVYYDPDTDLVYRAQAVVEQGSKRQVRQLFKRFKRRLLKAHTHRADYIKLQIDGHEAGYFKVYDTTDQTHLGTIHLHVGEDNLGYTLRVDYLRQLPVADL